MNSGCEEALWNVVEDLGEGVERLKHKTKVLLWALQRFMALTQECIMELRKHEAGINVLEKRPEVRTSSNVLLDALMSLSAKIDELWNTSDSEFHCAPPSPKKIQYSIRGGDIDG
jgi:hypothetical protein